MLSKGAVVPLRGLNFNQQRFPEALVKHPFAPTIDRRSFGYDHRAAVFG